MTYFNTAKTLQRLTRTFILLENRMAKGTKDITLIVSRTTRQISQRREERKREGVRGSTGTWESRSQSVLNTKSSMKIEERGYEFYLWPGTHASTDITRYLKLSRLIPPPKIWTLRRVLAWKSYCVISLTNFRLYFLKCFRLLCTLKRFENADENGFKALGPFENPPL